MDMHYLNAVQDIRGGRWNSRSVCLCINKRNYWDSVCHKMSKRYILWKQSVEYFGLLIQIIFIFYHIDNVKESKTAIW